MLRGRSWYFSCIFIFTCSDVVLTQNAADNSCEGKLETRIEALEDKVEKILNIVQAQARELQKQEHWEGTQSTFGSFKRLNNNEKSKLISFKLTDAEDVDVSTLIQELRPCTNLESIKLNRVELIGTFPNTTSGRVTLPKLHEIELLLNSYTSIAKHNILSNVVFVQKSQTSEDVTSRSVTNLKTDITIEFKGFKYFSIDHDLGELILGFDPENVEVLKGINPNVFSLKRLTVYSGSLNTSEIPVDLSYLNLKHVALEGQDNPTTQYMDVLEKTKRLRSLHIDTNFDSKYGALIDLNKLPKYLEKISFRSMRINTTGSYLLPDVESLLLNECQIDNSVIDGIKNSWSQENRCHVQL